MAESFWLDLNFSEKFGDVQVVFFSSGIQLVFQENPGSFFSVARAESILYQAVTLFPDQCPAADHCWKWIGDFLALTFSGPAATSLFVIANAHKTVYTARKSLSNLIKLLPSIRDENTLSEYASFVPPLFAFPDLHDLASALLPIFDGLSCSGTMRDAAADTVRHHFTNEMLKLMREKFYGPETRAVPVFFSMYVACISQSDPGLRAEYKQDLLGLMNQSPDLVCPILSEPNWFYWLFELIDNPDSSEDPFWMALGLLLDFSIELTGEAHILSKALRFLSTRPGCDWLKRSILLYLLRPEVMTPDRFFVLFDVTFECIFFQSVCDKRLFLSVDISENGEWRDIQIAVALMRAFDPQVRIKSTVLPLRMAYLVAQLLRFKSDKFCPQVCGLRCDPDIFYSAIAILGHVADLEGFAIVAPGHQLFDDPADSPAWQFFLFETKCLRDIEIIQPEFDSLLANLPHPAEPIQPQINEFFETEAMNMEGSRTEKRMLVESFLDSITIGPWARDIPAKFRASSLISKRGKRVLLALDREYEQPSSSVASPTEPAAGESVPLWSRLRATSLANAVAFSRVATLVSIDGEFAGPLWVSGSTVFFDGNSPMWSRPRRVQIELAEIAFLFTRRCLNQIDTCEIFTAMSQSFCFRFTDSALEFCVYINQHINLGTFSKPARFDMFHSLRTICNAIYQTVLSVEIIARLNLTDRWLNYEITNYEYLYWLNIIGGRSFHDLDSYPIYPFLISDFESPSINLQNPSIYRDLRLSAHGLSPHRRQDAEKRYSAGAPGDQVQFCAFYMTSAVVMHSLLRVEPFMTRHLAFHGGKIDTARSFHSYEELARGITDQFSIGRELVPEMFSFPQALRNESQFDFGVSATTGEKVDHVELPKWARDNEHVVTVHRVALESQYSSLNLHHWINLVFGIYRTDVNSFTVHFRRSYPECEPKDDWDMPSVPAAVRATGLAPEQLFRSEHPARTVTAGVRRSIPLFQTYDLGQKKVSKMRKSIILCDPGILIDVRSGQIVTKAVNAIGQLWGVSRSLGLAIFGTGLDMVITVIGIETGAMRVVSHESSLISCATIIGGEWLLTGGTNGSLSIWKIPGDPTGQITLKTTKANHCEAVIAVDGCADIGLIVSIDKEYNCAFQTMLQRSLIRKLKLDCVRPCLPLISVFKSGIVVIAYQAAETAKIAVFDVRGELLKAFECAGPLSEIDKYYHTDTREFVIVGFPRTIAIYDLCTYTLIKALEVEDAEPRFSALKGQGAVLAVSSQKLVILSFRDLLEQLPVDSCSAAV
jgi:hypothetical protein